MDPLKNPITGATFGANENPFEPSKPVTDVNAARALQEDFIATQSQKKPAATPTPTIIAPPPGGTTSKFETTPGVVDGSDGIRENAAVVRSDANSALTQLDQLQETSNTDLTKRLGDLSQLVADTKTLTDVDLKSIEEAGNTAGAAYDPLIAAAKEDKRQGMATSKVGAGERGGFENTQYAGQAALTQTEGNTFVGAGGKLSEIKGQLDLNITKLETAKLQAIQAARAAQQKAIRTGKQEDASQAMDLFNTAKDLYKTQADAITKRIDVISALEKNARERIQFGQEQEDRTIEGLVGNLDLTGDNASDTQAILKAAKESGVDPARLATAVTAFKNEQQQKAITLTQQKYNLSKQIPKGQTYTDPDTGLTIIGNDEPEKMDIVQTVGGNEFQVRYDLSDPTNPKELFRINLGPKYKGGGGNSSGTNTNTTLDQALLEAAKHLDELKQTGNFNDLTYEATIQAIYNEYPQVPDALPDGTLGTDLIRSTLNKKLEAIQSSKNAPTGSTAKPITAVDRSSGFDSLFSVPNSSSSNTTPSNSGQKILTAQEKMIQDIIASANTPAPSLYSK